MEVSNTTHVEQPAPKALGDTQFSNNPPTKADIEKGIQFAAGSITLKGNICVLSDGRILLTPENLAAENSSNFLISVLVGANPNADDPQTLYEKGVAMINSNITKNISDGVYYLQLAAEQGHKKSSFFLGCLYYLGGTPAQQQVIKQSYDLAYSHFNKAFKQGYSSAPVELFEKFLSHQKFESWPTNSQSEKLTNWILKNIQVSDKGSKEDAQTLLKIGNWLMNCDNRKQGIPLILQAVRLESAEAKQRVEQEYVKLRNDVWNGEYENPDWIPAITTSNGKERYALTLFRDFAHVFEHAVAYHDLGMLICKVSIRKSGDYKQQLQNIAETNFICADQLGYGAPGEALFDFALLLHNADSEFDMNSKAYEYFVKSSQKGHQLAIDTVKMYKEKNQSTMSKFGQLFTTALYDSGKSALNIQ